MSEKNKMGRPRLASKQVRGKFVSTRVSTPEYAEITAAVKRGGRPKTEWVRETLLSAARIP